MGEKAGIIEIIQVLADNVCALSALLVALGFAIAEIVAAWRGGGIVNFGTGGKENEQENCNRNDVACN